MSVNRQLEIPDELVKSLTDAFSIEIYDNTVVPEMEKWLKTSRSLQEFATGVTDALSARWPEIEARVTSLGSSHSSASAMGRQLSRSSALQLSSLADKAAVPVTTILAVVMSTVSGTLLGGAGTAFVMSGPLGWLLGAVAAAALYVVGRGKANAMLATAIHKSPIPAPAKALMKAKIQRALEQGRITFEDSLSAAIKQSLSRLPEARSEVATPAAVSVSGSNTTSVVDARGDASVDAGLPCIAASMPIAVPELASPQAADSLAARLTRVLRRDRRFFCRQCQKELFTTVRSCPYCGCNREK